MLPKSEAKALRDTVLNKRSQSLLLGCSNCPDLKTCGGLQVDAAILSCMDFCTCNDPNTCDVVCPRNPTFARRVREIEGFSFATVGKRRRLPFPAIADAITLVYRSLPLANSINADVIAIPFSEAYRRRGKRMVALTRAELEAKFRLGRATRLVLSGVEEDHHIEQWWGADDKLETLSNLRAAGVIAATTRNFSVIADAPRHDNLHAQKRILINWAEIHDAGIPVALHINARTPRDFQRFAEFLKFHDEIEAVAFEYTTGASVKHRAVDYTDELLRLRDQIDRPLRIVLRGGVSYARRLMDSFQQVVCLDTLACMKTINRRAAVRVGETRIGWRVCHTQAGEFLDELFAHNARTVNAWTADRCRLNDERKTPVASRRSQRQRNTDDESTQLSLLQNT